jgi:tRNA dimethylallyltransferase
MSLAGLMDTLPARNDEIRSALSALEDAVPGALYQLLQGIDRKETDRIGTADMVRLVRSLEIALLSGMKPSGLKQGGSPDSRFRFVYIEKDNAALRKGIKKRTSLMIAGGLVEEVKTLLDRGFIREPVLGATIGYSEIIDYLEGKCSLQQAHTAIETHTWQYARRQRNIFRRLPGVVSVSDRPEEIDTALFGERGTHGS